MPLSNPVTRNEYMQSLRSVFRHVRQIAKQQLTKVSEKRAGHKQGTNTWRPFHEGQTVMLSRPKGWKLVAGNQIQIGCECFIVLVKRQDENVHILQ